MIYLIDDVVVGNKTYVEISLFDKDVDYYDFDDENFIYVGF